MRRVSGGTDLVCGACSAEPGPGHPACLPLPRLQGMSLPSVLAGDSWLRLCPEGPAEAETEAFQQADPSGSLAHPGDAPMALALSSGHPCAFVTQGTHAVSAWGTGCGPRPPERLDPLPWALWRVEVQRARAQTRPPGVTRPGSCGTMLAGGRHGAGDPTPPVLWAGLRDEDATWPVLLCPLLWTSGCSGRLGVCPHPCLRGGRSGREVGVSRGPSLWESGPASEHPRGLVLPAGAW